MYWSPQAGKLRNIVSDIMTCNRWEMIKSKFHLVDNNSITDHALDKLFKIRPMVNSLREKFKSVPMEQHLAIDKQMVPFKGQSGIKMYMPNKPTK